MVVILTPKNSKDLDCHEVGRSFCTLMSSKYLQKKCYSITSKEELLNAVTDFECDSFVLPDIGNWEDKKLLSYQTIQELRERTRELRGYATKSDIEKSDNDISGPDVEKPGEIKKEYDPLIITRSPFLFGGVINEWKKRMPYYFSDFNLKDMTIKKN